MLQIGLSINRHGEPTADFLRSLADGGIQAVELSSSALAVTVSVAVHSTS